MRHRFITFLLLAFLLVLLSGSAAAQDTGNALLAEFNKSDKAAAGKKFVWAGNWKYNSRYWPVDVKIRMLPGGRFHFEVEALNGAHSGNIEGIARIKGSKAYFDDRTGKKSSDVEPNGCRLLFINHVSYLELKETNEECSAYGGAGVNFGRNKLLKGDPPVLEKNFVDRGVFPDLATDGKFHALVGAKDYELLLNYFHQVIDDTDAQLGAKVFTGCVTGICPWNTGIIIFDGKGKFWSAVNVLFDEPESGEVHYYSNDPAWAEKLPNAIEEWRKNAMPEIPVIYKNKKP